MAKTTLHVTVKGDTIEVRLPNSGGIMVNHLDTVEPGQTFYGLPYAKLKKLGTGTHELDDSEFKTDE